MTKNEISPIVNEPHFPGALIGPGSRPDSYLSQHPGFEPYIDGLVLDDTKQNCEASIGRRTVRLSDVRGVGLRYGAYPARSARGNRPGYPAFPGYVLDGFAVHVCGMQYAPVGNVDHLYGLDVATGPFGGALACGKALCSWGTPRRPEIHISVKLPDAVSDLLAADGIRREVWITLRDALDSSRTYSPFAWVCNAVTGSAVLLRATAFSRSYKHTRSVTVRSADDLEAFAANLPARIAAHAEALRAMAATVIDTDELLRLALIIANDGSDVLEAVKNTEAVWGIALDLVDLVRAANGSRVPKSPVPGLHTGIQLFEAAGWLDRNRTVRDMGDSGAGGSAHNHEALVRLNRTLDRELFADTALTVLAGMDPHELPAALPADWQARFRSVDNLPALGGIPAGYSVPAGVNVDAIRRLYCTTLAPSDAEADERIHRLMKVSDPLEVLAIVAPNVPVKDNRPPPSMVADPSAESPAWMPSLFGDDDDGFHAFAG